MTSVGRGRAAAILPLAFALAMPLGLAGGARAKGRSSAGTTPAGSTRRPMRDVVGRVGYELVGRKYLQVPPYGVLRRLAPKGAPPPLESFEAQHLELGPRLGVGGEKEVFALANDPSRVLAVAKENTPAAMNKILAERELLEEGAALGYPVAKMTVGTYQGRPAFLQERLKLHSNDKGFLDPAVLRQRATPRTLADLDRIYSISRRTHTGFVDFQYGLGDDGRILINDPRNFVRGPVVGPLMRFTVLRDREHIRSALEAK